MYADFWDAPTFARESLSVANKQGAVVPMLYTSQQMKLWLTVKRIRAQKKPVRLVILKYRRGGFSTGVASLLYQETVFTLHGGQKTLIIAHEGKAVKDSLLPMYTRFQKTYKPFRGIIGAPALSSDRKDGLDFENESSITIQTANNLEGARSFNFRRVHLSEYAFYRNAKQLMTGLMQTVPPDPDTIVIVESTANGLGNDFYKLYQQAKSGKTDWQALFFAWHEDAENWKELDQPPDIFQASLSDEETLLMQQYDLSLEQMYWRRWKIDNDFNGDILSFQQEYPINDREAFLVSGRPRFQIASIDRLQPVEGITGELIRQQVGLELKTLFQPNRGGVLTVWKRPEAKKQYVIGADTSRGIDINLGVGTADPDYSVAQVIDRDSREQVAILRGRLTPAEFAEYVNALGKAYNFAFIVPESNGEGKATVDALTNLHHYRLDRIYKRKLPDRAGNVRTELLGWETTVASRPKLISALDEALRQNTLIINSDVTQQELYSFVIKSTESGSRAEHAEGSHDDCVLSLALAVIGLNEAPVFQEQEARAIQTATARSRVRESYFGSQQERDDWND